jgi:hypothetical protein
MTNKVTLGKNVRDGKCGKMTFWHDLGNGGSCLDGVLK